MCLGSVYGGWRLGFVIQWSCIVKYGSAEQILQMKTKKWYLKISVGTAIVNLKPFPFWIGKDASVTLSEQYSLPAWPYVKTRCWLAFCFDGCHLFNPMARMDVANSQERAWYQSIWIGTIGLKYSSIQSNNIFEPFWAPRDEIQLFAFKKDGPPQHWFQGLHGNSTCNHLSYGVYWLYLLLLKIAQGSYCYFLSINSFKLFRCHYIFCCCADWH